MKILVLNGSPKCEKSNSLRLTNAFLEGFVQGKTLEIEMLHIYTMNIKPCIGCFACWNKTPGKCCQNDDMAEIIQKILEAQVIIWSFPLYYFGLPSQLKALLDRQLPMSLPFMKKREDKNLDNGSHPSRYDISGKRHVLISTCGFYTASGNYDSINDQFDRVLGKGGFETLYCGQGELFRVPELRKRTDEYLSYVKMAGREFAVSGISPQMREKLSELLYPREAFEQMADASWGTQYSEIQASMHDGEDLNDGSLLFTRQMAALYNKSAWNGTDKVLQMCYTDVAKIYQIVLSKDGQEVLTENFLPSTTKIETPLALWQSIAKGEVDGQQALMQHCYRVTGDFDLMLHWDDYFSAGKSKKYEEKSSLAYKKTNMTLLLILWFPVWIAMEINQTAGGIISISLCAMLPFAYLKWKPTVFEGISAFAVTAIGLLALFSFPIAILVPLSYLVFGVMWTVTVFLEIPLTAYYSMNDYGEEKAFANPLFVRTNRILTACWGALYFVTPVWTYFLMTSSVSWPIGAINSVLPILLGAFTIWFQKWYPPYYAKK